MVFIRIKKVKGKDYAYKVKSKWTKKGPRQKIKGYLGRVFVLEKVKDLDFNDFIKEDFKDYIENSHFLKIVKDVIGFELLKHGFSKELLKDNIGVDLSKSKVEKNKKDVVLRLNEGFLCRETLKRLISFKGEGEEDDIVYDLAESFVSAGINIDKEVFIELFQKLSV